MQGLRSTKEIHDNGHRIERARLCLPALRAGSAVWKRWGVPGAHWLAHMLHLRLIRGGSSRATCFLLVWSQTGMMDLGPERLNPKACKLPETQHGPAFAWTIICLDHAEFRGACKPLCTHGVRLYPLTHTHKPTSLRISEHKFTCKLGLCR